MPTLYIDEGAAEVQRERLDRVRASRDGGRLAAALSALKSGAAGTANTMPLIIDCVRARATVGEMCDALRDVWGEYEEVPAL